MASKGGPGIVTDRLVVCYDFGKDTESYFQDYRHGYSGQSVTNLASDKFHNLTASNAMTGGHGFTSSADHQFSYSESLAGGCLIYPDGGECRVRIGDGINDDYCNGLLEGVTFEAAFKTLHITASQEPAIMGTGGGGSYIRMMSDTRILWYMNGAHNNASVYIYTPGHGTGTNTYATHSAQFNHYTFTYDSASKMRRAYYNGINHYSDDSTDVGLPQTTQYRDVGLYASNINYAFKGAYAFFRVYGKALSNEEVQQNFQATRNRLDL